MFLDQANSAVGFLNMAWHESFSQQVAGRKVYCIYTIYIQLEHSKTPPCLTTRASLYPSIYIRSNVTGGWSYIA